MKHFIALFGVFFAFSASAALVELDSAQEMENLVATSSVPVVIQFSAYWCGPCKVLTSTMQRVAQSYDSNEVILAKVDAHVHSSLRKYLMGGYPTVRVFNNGQVNPTKYFAGSQTESMVRDFIDGAIDNPMGRGLDFSFPAAPYSAVQ